MLVRGLSGRLGADPIAQALNLLGLTALILLVASLACTPLKTVFGWTWPIRIRRELGLFAFFYAALHVLTYAGIDQSLDVGAIFADVVKRKFIFVGFTAFVLLVPLALTSTQDSVKRLGFVKWKRLHRLVYVAAILAAIHFLWRVKADLREPLTYAGIVTGLLLVRAATYARSRRASRTRAEDPG
jgi:sulfoxide reductase heme-binding subunit YedZ